MFKDLTRREFVKTASMAALAMAIPAEIFASPVKADLVVYGKIFTAENNKIVEAFAVKDGKFVYVGDKKRCQSLYRLQHRSYRPQRQRFGYAFVRKRSRALFDRARHSESRNDD